MARVMSAGFMVLLVASGFVPETPAPQPNALPDVPETWPPVLYSQPQLLWQIEFEDAVHTIQHDLEVQMWLAEEQRILAEQAEAERAHAAYLASLARPRPTTTRSGYPALTPAGLSAMKMCESTNNYQIDTGNSFLGAVQWLQSTWNAAAARAGYHDWVGVYVPHVPPEIQDAVTYSWWSASNPSTQWPVCHRRALTAMGA